ncbi:glutathione ABC transporter substrate-binding protein [Virgibacillus necropolis]|uniref:glutathione ABC transporter substrate-binding protein n=1 Tax=Virgibacillus necropolis TaxID=163877 RepID=UPI00384FB8A5
MTKLKRFVHGKSGLMLVVLLLTVMFLQACSTTGGAEESDDGSQSEANAEGGTLKVLIKADATNLDPHFITNIDSANIIYQKVYETLVAFNDDMEIVPNLAKDWKQIDETTWQFKLNEGITFHDGAPFNAKAVKATFDRLLDPETGSPQREKLGMIEEVKVIDEATVQLILSKPYAPLLSILASNEGSIISPKAIAESPKSLASHPVGTGPFVFESWNTGQDITLVKNEDYWGEKPKIDKVVFEVIPESATRLAMIETGEAHITDTVPISEIERIKNSDTLNLYQTDGLAVSYIAFNVQNAPVDNVKLRKAISHAVERDAIIKGIFNDVGTLANSAMSPKVFGYSENIKPYEYNINKAKQLMEEAGFKDGVNLTLVTNDRQERVRMAEVIKSQLKGIGVNVEIQVLEYGAYIDAIDKGDYQMMISGWGNATGDGDYNQYNLFHSDSHGLAGNLFYYSNNKVDKLLETARSETSSEKREELYEKAMKIEMEDAVYIPIRNYQHLAVYNNNVEDFKISPVSYIMIDNATVK